MIIISSSVREPTGANTAAVYHCSDFSARLQRAALAGGGNNEITLKRLFFSRELSSAVATTWEFRSMDGCSTAINSRKGAHGARVRTQGQTRSCGLCRLYRSVSPRSLHVYAKATVCCLPRLVQVKQSMDAADTGHHSLVNISTGCLNDTDNRASCPTP